MFLPQMMFLPLVSKQGISQLWNSTNQSQKQEQQPQTSSSDVFNSPTAYTSIGDSTGYNYINKATTPEQKNAQKNLNNKIGVTNPAQSVPSGSTTTPPVNQGGGGSSSGGIDYNAMWRAAGNTGDRPIGWFGPGNNSGQNNIENEISDMYKQYIGVFDQIGQNLRDQAAQDEQMVDRQYQEGYKKAQGEGQDLMQDLSNKINDFNESYRSAVGEAIRAYQNLNQQRMSRYGGGSSVGGALGELANTEFLRNQGKLLAQRASGEQAFNLEGSRLKKYVDEKLSSWDSWKADALDKIRTKLRDGLSEIAMRKGEAELNKTKDRIALLQDSINRARQVQDMDTQFRQNLISYAVQKAAELGQNNFTISDIPGVVNQLMGYNILGTPGRNVPVPVRKGVKYDEFGNLILE